MKKRVSALFLIVAMVVSGLTGCGEKDLYVTAMQKANDAKSVEATATMDFAMKISAGGQEVPLEMKMDMDMSMFTEPLKTKVDATMNMSDKKVKMTNYIAKEGDNYMSYMNSEGKWMKMTVCPAGEIETAKQQSGIFEAASFMRDKASLTEKEDVTENDKTYQVYDGKMTKEMLKESMKSSMGGLTSSLTGGTIDEEMMNKMIDNMADVPYTLWLDKETESLYRVKFSMKGLMESVMETAMKEALKRQKGVESLKITVDKCDMDIIYKNYDAAQDFEIPKEALAAKEEVIAK